MSGDGGGLTHIDARGRAIMVDVTGKATTHRRAVTSVRVTGFDDAPGFIDSHLEYLSEARVAGLTGAKATPRLIPLCHPLPIETITIDFAVEQHAIEIVVTTETFGQTGVEMEGMCAAAVAALSLLGRARFVARGASIEGLGLQEKSGGRSGLWQRDRTAPSDLSDASRDAPSAMAERDR